MIPSIEQPFAAKDVPLTRDGGKARLENIYVPARKTKAIAIGPGGQYFMVVGLETVEEAARRSLESCGAIAGVPCMIVALDDNFVVPVPMFDEGYRLLQCQRQLHDRRRCAR